MQLDINPQISARLTTAAQSRGIDPTRLVEALLADSLPPVETVTANAAAPKISARNAAAIAYLDWRLKEEVSDDPEEIRKADEEVAELKRNMNANRAATGERPVFS